MSTTHVGKIGRLPKYIRDQLNRRIEDGEPGRELVKWLNCEPDALHLLQEQFEGRPITEQNLSEWKQRGYPEWLQQQETRLLVSNLTEQAEDLDEAADGMEISDRFASVIAAELICVTSARLKKETDTEKRCKIIYEVLPKLSQLQCDGHRAVRTLIKRERWNRQMADEDEEADKRREKEEIKSRVDRFFAIHEKSLLAETLGGGEYGKKWADWLVRVQHGLSMPDWARMDNRGPDAPAETKPSPTKSDPIQANPTNFSNGHAPFAGVHDYVI
ncbi:MAG TPA: hypothetical protein VMD27_03315 [Candidatus Aquilonibacter sp.]|nr:hypothetical protein [Candidatus Aquilonibacter sp.]